MNKLLFVPLVAALLPGIGCTLAPRYSRPAAPVPASWPGDARPLTNAPAAQDLSWPAFFPDPHLRQVISLALTNSRDLRLAVLNAQEARALYGIQRAELLPAINGSADLLRERLPADLSSTGQRITTSEYDVNLGAASWEIDFFGRIRSLKNEALQQYFASEQARRGAQILLVSSVAQTYLTLAADRENLQIAETTLDTQRKSFALVRHRHELGLVPDLDLYRAKTPVDSARRDVAAFRQAVAQDQNALNLLAGLPVPDAWLPTNLEAVLPPHEIAAGLSSSVLLTRPDVLQAEAQLKAANADIGAARAAFFPRISLTAAIGTASSDLSGLFKAGQGAWSYAPQVVLPIFDARTWSAHRASQVQRDVAVAQYERAVQSAFRDVADALAARANLGQQLAAQQSLVQATAETYRLANSRYEKGIDSYLSVLDGQRSLFAAQQALVSLQLAAQANQVRLYAALGGGSPAEFTPAYAFRSSSGLKSPD
jgi:multidrug efflux system outer membrane protein